MTVNQRTIDLIKRFEGFRSKAYRDIAGIWTIGYGTTAAAGVGIAPKEGMVITEPEATLYLRRAIDVFAAKIAPKITAPINENEFGAFVSLAYNIGPGAFNSSSALRHFNAGRKAEAANAILAWNKATVGGKKVVVKGLANRRAEERNLFLTPVSGAPPIPAPKTPAGPTSPQIGGWWAILARFVAAIFGGKK